MPLFYKTPYKQLLQDRNNIFKQIGVPALEKNGFVKSPFKGAWHGEYYSGHSTYCYVFCRITQNKFLEVLHVSIRRKEKSIVIHLFVNELLPNVDSIDDLKGYDGFPFSKNVKNHDKYMHLRLDDYKGPPIFYMFFFPRHKIGTYFTKSGYANEVNKLTKLIKKDMENIDRFVKRWHEIHKPNLTDWKGNDVAKKSE